MMMYADERHAGDDVGGYFMGWLMYHCIKTNGHTRGSPAAGFECPRPASVQTIFPSFPQPALQHLSNGEIRGDFSPIHIDKQEVRFHMP